MQAELERRELAERELIEAREQAEQRLDEALSYAEQAANETQARFAPELDGAVAALDEAARRSRSSPPSATLSSRAMTETVAARQWLEAEHPRRAGRARRRGARRQAGAQEPSRAVAARASSARRATR